ncbi:AAA family ATPase [Thioalkalivibrio sulfidiphilus]|uniref:bifunctional aminoglycoside phosphotransferase/ATP-binding protein n=1 Tax=Thioalkalivibrio sulfidiphilus TaxID=1033854 RepID=UPI003BB02667
MDVQTQIQHRLIEALRRPEHYPHPVDAVECIETHISWVLLAGAYAYKFKKPLDLGFLDFSTLERRRFFCEEELRINRRLAPDLYQAVVGFSGDPDHPAFNGQEQAFEYAVRMARFDRDRQLDALLERNALPLAWMDELADCVADFHGRIPSAAPDDAHGSPEAVLAPMTENFRQLRPLVNTRDRLAQLDRLEAWTLEHHRALSATLDERHRQGFVRECHGDMHLGNMAHIDGHLLIFDGIEFSEALRWTDIISEVAFVTMDLMDRGAPSHANRFLNAWLERSGDYSGLTLLRFYQVYRAMVRAKVSGIRLGQAGIGDTERAQAEARCHGYLDLAERLTHPARPVLFINHGLSGSGKTTASQPLVEQLGLIRIRSDVERKRLAGMDRRERDLGGVSSGIYSSEMGERTYARLEGLATAVLGAGFSVIVDATFLKRAQRDRFASLARHLGVPFHVLDYQAPEDVLRARIRARQAADRDASDAGIEVLEHQLASAQTLGADEPVVVIDTQTDVPIEAIGRLMG